MAGHASAYAALGLEPDADAAAIDKAYKRLIKRHHPDRAGGDASRAAEINRAYRELRRDKPGKDPLEWHEEWSEGRQPRGWIAAALLVALSVVALVFATGALPPVTERQRPNVGHVAAAANVGDVMDKPLNAPEIDRAIGRAVDLARTSDEMALAGESADCHGRLRVKPSLAQLDRCAAFDDAVVASQNRDPLRDQGPFSQLAVSRRQWSGAAAMSADYLAVDGRLDRIRLRVEMALAPQVSPEPPAANVASE